MPEKIALEEVQGKALETAYRLSANSMYGGKKANAVRALKRRCPGWDSHELGFWLTRALSVQEAATAWLRKNEEAAFEAYERHEPIDSISRSFCEAHQDWPKTELDSLLSINFLYFYLM